MDRPPGRGADRRVAASILTRRADDEAEQLALGDIAVMYRTNAQSRAIEEAFLRYGIRYQLVGGTRFYQRREVKDALAYLRILRSDADSVASSGSSTCRRGGSARRRSRSCVPRRPVGAQRASVPWAAAIGGRPAPGRSRRSAPRPGPRWPASPTLVARLRDHGSGCCRCPSCSTPSSSDSGYRAMLADGSEEGEERWTNLLELRSVTTRYDDLDARRRARPASWRRPRSSPTRTPTRPTPTR